MAMTRGALFRELCRQRTLAAKRSPMFTAGQAGKWVMAFMALFAACYLLMFAVMLAYDAAHSRSYSPTEYIMGTTVFVLVIDFIARLLVQDTPAHIVKPYLLLPIRTRWLIDFFVLRLLVAPGNAVWLFLFLPYTFMAVLFPCGAATALSLLVLWWLIILAESQWYAIVRTLAVRNIAWWLLSVLVAAALCLPWFLSGHFEDLFNAYTVLGSGMERGNLLPHAGVLVLLVLLVAVNRQLQYAAVRDETAGSSGKSASNIKAIGFLSRLGLIGQYMKIEVWSLLRNKNPRKAFISATAVIAVVSAVVCLTGVYDNIPMGDFWCLYCFSLYGLMLLVRTMSYEGNYLPCLLMHQGSLERLLRAKYYFYCAVLVLPFLLMLPMVLIGKWPLMMLLGGALFTSGVQYFLILQAAVYNYSRLPLNTKFTDSRTSNISGVQTFIGLVVLGVPMALVSALRAIAGDSLSWTIMLFAGLVMTAAHRWWLRNIAQRIAARRYKHLAV